MKSAKRILTIAAVFGALMLNSCHRGYGCPNNFSVGDAVDTLVSIFSNLI